MGRVGFWGLFLRVVWFGGVVSFCFTVVFTFFVAFFNGYKAVVCVNCFGEAWLEALLLPFFAVVFLFVSFVDFRRWLIEKFIGGLMCDE